MGVETETINDHNGQDLPEGLEDMEGLCDPEDEPEFPNDLNCEVLAMCNRYKTVFSEHLKRGRHIKGAPMRINLVPEEKRVKPLYHAVPRVVPLHWREEADKIVKNLLKHDIIKQVDYPTVWCSRVFFVAKPGGSRGLRLVTDFCHLNKNISRAHHFFPSVNDIKKRIRHDTKYFIKLDLTSLYHQLKIDKADRDLTTFAIGEGLYKFRRAAMGLSASSDSFCRRVFQGLPGSSRG